MRAGQDAATVFPRLSTVATQTSGDGVTLKVHFTNTKKEGAPVRYIGGDDPAEAAAVREIDLRKKFHMRPSELASALKLSEPKSKALRWRLQIDDDKDCRHDFEFGKTSIPCFSDNARNRMKAALDGGLDMGEVWLAYQTRGHAPGPQIAAVPAR